MKEIHTRNTLSNWSKEDLIDHVMCLEHNNKVLKENFDIQYKNCIKILDDMKLINDIYKHREKEVKGNE
ncbi:MAG: hypothetical protein RR585_01825 [Coprobacillus sp.]